MSLYFSFSCIFYISFCVKSFPSELNPQSGPQLEPLSCWSALTLTPLFISGTQLSRSQVEESQRERQECKLVSQISTSTLAHSSHLYFNHFLFPSIRLALSPLFPILNMQRLETQEVEHWFLLNKFLEKVYWERNMWLEIACCTVKNGKTLPHLCDVTWNAEDLTTLHTNIFFYAHWYIKNNFEYLFHHLLLTTNSCFSLFLSRGTGLVLSSRSLHVWSVGPGDLSQNPRHTCAGRSSSAMQSR